MSAARVLLAGLPFLRHEPRGSGGPYVLLHGFTGRPESWEEVAARLDGPVLVPFLPGHAPDVPAGDFADAVGALARALREAGPRVLAGYSMGGRLALGLALRHPDVAPRIVLVGAHPGLPSAAERAARAAEDAARAAALRAHGLAAFLDAWERAPLFATQADLPAEVLRRQRELRERHDAAALADALERLGLAAMPDFGPELARIGVPVDLVTGERDAKFRALAGEMAARLPRARHHVVPGVGHNVPLEAPAALAAILRGN